MLVPVDAAWRALTTSAGLDAWFCDGASVDPRAGGAISFRWKLPEGVLHSGGDVLEVRERERFVFTWDPVHADRSVKTRVEIDFEAVPGGCTVRVRETGFPHGDAGRQSFHDNATGWGEALALLRAHLERGGIRWLPFQST
jgi:uncharacterized protein YndB with AHSA1/START domain